MHPFESYLSEIAQLRGATKETSGYPALSNLLNAIGHALKPKVKCIIHPKNSGAGIPDGGLFTPDQLKNRAEENSFEGQQPARGAIEVKSAGDDLDKITKTSQIEEYVKHYGQLLLTNYREFILLKRAPDGKIQRLESFQIADDEKSFWLATAHPRKAANELGERFAEYLKRVLLHSAPLNNPKDVAFFLASYARDARVRVEAAKDLPALAAVRIALEEALGMKFEADKGEHFFRSTLVQTLFYGVFSAWVLWHKESPQRTDEFEWKSAGWTLHVPMIKGLYDQIAAPTKLRPLGLVEVLDWTAAALNRIDRAEFFARFVEDHAVQYFYEPFLEAFDPELRKELGVWYTPPEIVKYQVARVDAALREELDIPDGLADPRVFVLDPCCGTGAYLVEVLKRIEQTLKEKGEDALAYAEIKEAAQKRVLGFEIMPAPFVVAHLQMGLLLQNLAVPLDDANNERAGIFLTNALTGWDFAGENPKLANWPELEAERKGAGKVKQEKPILVILGNPPYNAYAGVSPEEEQGLVEPYKTGLVKEWGIKKFNLDDLYVRFFRIAERRIAEKTGKGIVCFISNYSYLGDPSFVVMRRRFLQEFDSLWFDCMNGDSRETGKLTPEGKPDPSVFSTEYNREGIRVGTAIGLLVRQIKRGKKPRILFRQFWGANKRAEILASIQVKNFAKQYEKVQPERENRFSFCPSEIASHYYDWPSLTEISSVQPAYGHMETRGLSLISFDKQELELRLRKYFDPNISNEEMASVSPELMAEYARYNGMVDREVIQKKMTFSTKFIRRFHFKPFDVRFCYADAQRPLWSEPSTSLSAQAWEGNGFLISRLAGVKSPEGHPFLFSPNEFERDVISGHARAIPVRLREVTKTKQKKNDDGNGVFGSILNEAARRYEAEKVTANLSPTARTYLNKLGIKNPDDDDDAAALIWMHALAIGYSPAYLSGNADGIRQDWPRIPLPNSKTALLASAELGKQVAALLETDSPLTGVTAGKVRPELVKIAVVTRLTKQPLNLSLTAGWGYAGQNGVTMPGKGKLVTAVLDKPADEKFPWHELHDVYLNESCCWKDVPAEVWDFIIGGYQVIKKWLSYREFDLLGRALTPDEAREVTHMARRIAALILLQPELDKNYQAVKAAIFDWKQ